MIDQKKKNKKKKTEKKSNENTGAEYFMTFKVSLPFSPSDKNANECVLRITDCVLTGLQIANDDFPGIDVTHSTVWETKPRKLPIVNVKNG